MKRINPLTGKIFRLGDTREKDRRIFLTYSKTRIHKRTGYYKETWSFPEKAKKTQYKYSPTRAKSVSQKLKRRFYWLRKYKVAKGCVICGYNKTGYALDFDHISTKGKIAHISKLVRGNMKTLFEQIRKCRVLCANCHRESTERKEYDL